MVFIDFCDAAPDIFRAAPTDVIPLMIKSHLAGALNMALILGCLGPESLPGPGSPACFNFLFVPPPWPLSACLGLPLLMFWRNQMSRMMRRCSATSTS